MLLVELDSGTGRGGRGGGTGPGRAWALGRDLGGHVSGASRRLRLRLRARARVSAHAQGRGSLTAAPPARAAGVSHACFPSFSGGRPLLLSGGNDGRVLLWDWAGVSGALAGRAEGRAPSGEAGGAAAPTARVVAEVGHGRKARRPPRSSAAEAPASAP